MDMLEMHTKSYKINKKLNADSSEHIFRITFEYNM